MSKYRRIQDIEGLQPSIIQKIIALENVLGLPIMINADGGAKRTAEDQKRINPGNMNSRHIYGDAVDVSGANLRKVYTDQQILDAAKKVGITGIGLYDWGFHFDARPDPHPRGFSFWDNRSKKQEMDLSMPWKSWGINVTPSALPDDIGRLAILIGLSMLGVSLVWGGSSGKKA